MQGRFKLGRGILVLSPDGSLLDSMVCSGTVWFCICLMRLPKSSSYLETPMQFLFGYFFLTRDCNILPKMELHRTVQVGAF